MRSTWQRWLVLLVCASMLAAASCLVDVKDYRLAAGGAGGAAGGTSSAQGGAGGAPGGHAGDGGQGAQGGGGGSASDSQLGDTCNANKPCQAPLLCVAPTDGEAGPAGGACTKGCSSHDECPANGYCIEISVGLGYCLERCTHGDGDASKCHGRRDAACTPVDDPDVGTVDLCLPVCNDDSECGPSRVCNRRSRLCENTYGGWSINRLGVQCNPMGGNFCVGYCPDGACQEDCVLGAPLSCQSAGLGPDPNAACVRAAFSGGQVGDLGHCAPSCTCDADCNGAYLCNIDVSGMTYCGPQAMGGGEPVCP